MKKYSVALLVLSLMYLPSVSAKDPNKSLLCLAGMYQGAGKVAGCAGAVKDYSSIRKWSRHHHHWRFDGGATKSARGSFLSGAAPNGGWAGRINNRYGALYNM
jgi:hypothetical protein